MVARAMASHAGESEETTWHIWSLTHSSLHFSSSIQAITWCAGERYRLQEVASWPGWVAGAAGWVRWPGMGVNTSWEIVGVGIMNGQEHGVSAHGVHDGEGSCPQ